MAVIPLLISESNNELFENQSRAKADILRNHRQSRESLGIQSKLLLASSTVLVCYVEEVKYFQIYVFVSLRMYFFF